VCFNPAEEIGASGTEKPGTRRNSARTLAYTLDSGKIPAKSIYESFLAPTGRVVDIRGNPPAHPGWAKGSQLVKRDGRIRPGEFIHSTCPAGDSRRSGTSGPIRASSIRWKLKGTAERVVIEMLLRDFELDGLEQKGPAPERSRREVKRHGAAAQQDSIRNLSAVPQHALTGWKKTCGQWSTRWKPLRRDRGYVPKPEGNARRNRLRPRVSSLSRAATRHTTQYFSTGVSNNTLPQCVLNREKMGEPAGHGAKPPEGTSSHLAQLWE